jgi:hypothetical protein
MGDLTSNALAYYALPGLMTDPGEYARLLEELPTEIDALCETVQGLLLHIFWAERYGARLSRDREDEVRIRRVDRMLARVRELDERPLTVARPLERRLVGNCRDFATLLCGFLRHQGVPARARCGFGAYFKPQHFEDHWVCEVWREEEARWVLADAQLDGFQREALNIPFDPCDVPRDQFLVAGQAWQWCRTGQADPERFGIFDMHGMWFIRGDLLRDTASLNKVELLPWDGWGLTEREDGDLSAEDMALLDRVAALTVGVDESFAELRATYEGDPRLRVPPTIWGETGEGV